MEEKEIKSEKETKYEQALREILDENINLESQGKDVDKMTSNYTDYDKTNNMLLKYYNERTESDFQKELKKQLNLDVYKKVQNRFDSIDEEVNEKMQEEQIRDISKETLEGEKVDKNIEKRAIKKAKEKAGEDEEIDLKAEVMKAVYEEAFDRYSALLEKYKMAQLRDEAMTIGDKEGTELVLYEKYLTNLERNYSRYAKSRGFDIKTLSDEPEIKAKKEKLEYDMKKMTRFNDMYIDDNLQRIKILSDKRNAIAEKMTDLSENRRNMSPEQFKQSMDYYQKLYFDLTVELRSQDPSLQEYKKQLEIENENEGYYQREIGISAMDGNISHIEVGDYKEEVEKYLTDEKEEKIYGIEEEQVAENEEHLSDMIKEAKEALAYGDLSRAQEIIESAESIANIQNYELDFDESNNENEEVKEEVEAQENPFMQQMQSGVANEKQRFLQERLRKLEEYREEKQNIKQIEEKENAYIRTRKFGNRNS